MAFDADQKWSDTAYIRERTWTEEPCMYCTPAGRVVAATPVMKELMGEEVIGRNLNDLLEDSMAARLIADGVEGRTTDLRCMVRGTQFLILSQPWADAPGLEIIFTPQGVREPGDRWNDPQQSLLIARELNLDLGNALASADILFEEQGSEHTEKWKCRLRQSIFRMIRLSRSLQDSAELELGQVTCSFEALDLTVYCRELLEKLRPICEKANISLNWDLPEGMLDCRADPDLLQQMICHLVSNAIQAQPKGGAIDVTVKEALRDEITITVSDRGKQPGTSVPDSAFRPRDPGELHTQKGLRMGLPLTRAFAELHGGRLLLMRTGDAGLVAKIILPRNRQTAVDMFRSHQAQYGTGLDPVLVNMSTVADSSFYRFDPPEKR